MDYDGLQDVDSFASSNADGPRLFNVRYLQYFVELITMRVVAGGK